MFIDFEPKVEESDVKPDLSEVVSQPRKYEMEKGAVEERVRDTSSVFERPSFTVKTSAKKKSAEDGRRSEKIRPSARKEQSSTVQGVRRISPKSSADEEYSRKMNCALCQTVIETIEKGGDGHLKDRKIQRSRQHAETHLSQFWNCPLCNFKSNRKGNIRTHLKLKHKNETTDAVLSIPEAEYDVVLNKMTSRCFPAIIQTKKKPRGISWQELPELTPKERYSKEVSCAICQKKIETIGKRVGGGWRSKKSLLTTIHAVSHLPVCWTCPLPLRETKFKSKLGVQKHLKKIHNDTTSESALLIPKAEYDKMLKEMVIQCFPPEVAGELDGELDFEVDGELDTESSTSTECIRYRTLFVPEERADMTGSAGNDFLFPPVAFFKGEPSKAQGLSLPVKEENYSEKPDPSPSGNCSVTKVWIDLDKKRVEKLE